MKGLRIVLLIFFLAVAGIYGWDRYERWKTEDVVAPVIRADTDMLELPVSADDKDLMEGMTVHDNADGDLTGTLIVTSKSNLIGKGTIHVNYAAFDRSMNVGTYQRTVRYTDYVSPHFSVTAPLNALASLNSTADLAQYVTAADCLDGDITNNIKFVYGTFVADRERNLTFEVTNSVGDTASIKAVVSLASDERNFTACPWLDEYVYYVKSGESIDFDEHLLGAWTGNGGVSMRHNKTFEDCFVRYSDEKVDYQTPGQYSGYASLIQEVETPNPDKDLSEDEPDTITEEEVLGTADFYVIVEE